jgi:hypothetical protein
MIVSLMVRSAMRGDKGAAEALAAYAFGRPKFQLEHAGIPGGAPIPVETATKGPSEIVITLGEPSRRPSSAQ